MVRQSPTASGAEGFFRVAGFALRLRRPGWRGFPAGTRFSVIDCEADSENYCDGGYHGFDFGGAR